VPLPQAQERKDAPDRVSYAGAAGGLLGAGMMTALGIAIAFGASDSSSWWSLAFFLLALMFVPATIACLTPAPRRNGILRATVLGCLVSALTGAILIDPTLPVLLTLPTLLLAQAAGLIFQSKR